MGWGGGEIVVLVAVVAAATTVAMIATTLVFIYVGDSDLLFNIVIVMLYLKPFNNKY